MYYLLPLDSVLFLLCTLFPQWTILFNSNKVTSFLSFSRMTRAKSELCIVNYANRNLCSWLLNLAFCIFEKSFWEALHFLCEWSKKNLSGHRSSFAANQGQNVFMTFPFSSKLSVKIGTICQRSNLVYPYQTFKSKGEWEGGKWRLFQLSFIGFSIMLKLVGTDRPRSWDGRSQARSKILSRHFSLCARCSDVQFSFFTKAPFFPNIYIFLHGQLLNNFVISSDLV